MGISKTIYTKEQNGQYITEDEKRFIEINKIIADLKAEGHTIAEIHEVARKLSWESN